MSVEGVLDADNARIGDSRVSKEDSFELGRSDLKAGDFDKFLGKRLRPISGSSTGRIFTFNRSTM